MSAARLPLAYRDSCAHLLIPLNRCRHEEYYLPWKCEVRPRRASSPEHRRTNRCTERASHIRKVPVRGVQGARGQDGRAEGCQGRSAKQLRNTKTCLDPGEESLRVYTSAASMISNDLELPVLLIAAGRVALHQALRLLSQICEECVVLCLDILTVQDPTQPRRS